MSEENSGNNILKLLFFGFIVLLAFGLWKKADRDEKTIDEEMRLREQNPNAVIQHK